MKEKTAFKNSSGSQSCKLFSNGFGSGKMKDQISFCKTPKKSFGPFCSASLEIIGVKVWNKQTDRQILGHHIRVHVDIFFQLNLLPPYSVCFQGDNWLGFRVLLKFFPYFCFYLDYLHNPESQKELFEFCPTFITWKIL